MGYNRSGVKFVKRMKRRRREEMRLAQRSGGKAEAVKPAAVKPAAAKPAPATTAPATTAPAITAPAKKPSKPER